MMAEVDRLENATLENVRFAWRPNFAGKEDQYNRAGNRNFDIRLPLDVAEQMASDGWNVKYTKPREDGDDPMPYINITVGYGGGRPPQVTTITSRGRTNLSEEEVEILDWADITNMDLVIRPYHWTVNGKSGVKAYLYKLFVTVEEDDLDRKYADIPDNSAPRGPRFEEED